VLCLSRPAGRVWAEAARQELLPNSLLLAKLFSPGCFRRGINLIFECWSGIQYRNVRGAFWFQRAIRELKHAGRGVAFVSVAPGRAHARFACPLASGCSLQSISRF